MNEFELIKTYFQQPSLSWKTAQIVVGNGDDCAVVSSPENNELCFSIDTLVEAVHFPTGARAYDIGTRALCVTLSDLASMGAQPAFFTLAITLPELNEHWLKGFSEGLAHIAQKFQCPLVGGDTTKGEQLTITIQVHGWVPRGKAMTRNGAKVGDKVYVSGELGDAAGALQIVLENPRSELALTKRYHCPYPEVEKGIALREYASSCIDISDGLLQDLQHICNHSQVGMELDADAIPMSAELTKNYSIEESLKFALTGGDDYRLAFTGRDIPNAICIGTVVAGTQVTVKGVNQEMLSPGYQHF